MLLYTRIWDLGCFEVPGIEEASCRLWRCSGAESGHNDKTGFGHSAVVGHLLTFWRPMYSVKKTSGK